MKDLPAKFTQVDEVQGLYGAFIFSERLLQKIWLRGEYSAEGLRTNDGRPLVVLQPGKWNRLGGPDFKDARLQLGEKEVRGDVELHLHAEDWAAHRHAEDCAYAQVVLHVVLFPTDDVVTRGVGGREIPVVSLLTNLSRGLEEYAADEAVESLSRSIRSEVFAELGSWDDATLRQRLRAQARARWAGKLHYAQLRIERLGWTQACHTTALEILGFRFNRAPMIAVATRFPLEAWSRDRAVQSLLAASADWRFQGVRPANHPHTRFEQYAQWTKHCPDWPDVLLAVASELAPLDSGQSGTVHVRREARFTRARTAFETQICGAMVGGSRLDTLICDGFLPLLNVQMGRDFSEMWFNWFVGDMPDEISKVLRELGVFGGPSQPRCHGFAQGLLGWMLEREAIKSLSEGLYRGGRLDNT